MPKYLVEKPVKGVIQVEVTAANPRQAETLANAQINVGNFETEWGFADTPRDPNKVLLMSDQDLAKRKQRPTEEFIKRAAKKKV